MDEMDEHLMFRKLNSLIHMFLIIGFIQHANASDVQLVPDSPVSNLKTGELVDINVYIDFSDVAGGTLGGGFDIGFDPVSLQFMGFNNVGLGIATLGRDPDLSAGLLESWAVGEFQGLASEGSTFVGTVQFKVLSTIGTETNVSISATGSIGGPWISGEDFLTVLQPSYNQIEITPAPDQLFKNGFETLTN